MSDSTDNSPENNKVKRLYSGNGLKDKPEAHWVSAAGFNTWLGLQKQEQVRWLLAPFGNDHTCTVHPKLHLKLS